MSVIAISTLVMGASMDANSRVIPNQPIAKLQQVLCIQYLAQFSQHLIQALINFGVKDNAMQANFVQNFGLHI